MNEPNDTEFKMYLSQSKEIQQEYYELLPDWTLYEKEDYEILKMNVGYALFGSPRIDSEEDDKKKMYTIDHNSKTHFSQQAINAIQVILRNIFDYGKMENGNIYCGVIYNITFDITEHNIYPIFKIKNTSEINQTVSSNNVWYIDHNGRVYENWNNYKDTNTLPPCIMVVPKDGQYQADPTCSITDTSSTVWLDIVPSSACSLQSKICNKVDKVSTVLTLGSAGIGLLSLATPVTAPIALAGLISAGVSSTWTTGRSVQEIMNRYSHKESIMPTNGPAFRAWLSIAGSVMGVASSAGTMLLSKTAQTGANIGNSARIAYNTTVVGNLSVNFVGLGYNGYCLWEKYQTEKRVDIVDVVFFTTHLMFFGNAVTNIQFASKVITATQGKIMKDYEATLRSKRHRKAYNRVKRNASTPSEIVRHIRKVNTRRELLGLNDKISKTNDNTSTDTLLKFTNTKVMFGNVTLFDPVVFVKTYMNSGNLSSSLLNSTVRLVYNDLSVILSNCLKQYSTKYPFIRNIVLADFHSVLSEMQHITNGQQVLKLILDIVIKIIDKSSTFEPFIVNIVTFVWKYVISHLEGHETGSHDTDCTFLMNIILTIRDNIERLMNRFLTALRYHFSEQNMSY